MDFKQKLIFDYLFSSDDWLKLLIFKVSRLITILQKNSMPKVAKTL